MSSSDTLRKGTGCAISRNFNPPHRYFAERNELRVDSLEPLPEPIDNRFYKSNGWMVSLNLE